jgi:hypothetical protein
MHVDKMACNYQYWLILLLSIISKAQVHKKPRQRWKDLQHTMFLSCTFRQLEPLHDPDAFWNMEAASLNSSLLNIGKDSILIPASRSSRKVLEQARPVFRGSGAGMSGTCPRPLPQLRFSRYQERGAARLTNSRFA